MQILSSLAKSSLAVLALGIVATPLPSVHASPAPMADTRTLQDVVLVIDGTEIDADSWSVQRAGIKAALQDSATFPLDGSVAVSVVEYADNGNGQRSKVAVPFTVLDSARALSQVLASVSTMEPLGDGGEAVDGVSVASALLSRQGRVAATWTTCVSPRSDWTAATDFSTAARKAVAAGVDRIPVLAVEGLATEEELTKAFDRDLSVTDTTTIASGVAEFNTLLISSCLAPPVTLRALEVNQVIQDWNDSVPLIEDKATLVRAFIEAPTKVFVRASAQLRAYRGGVQLTGSPLSPANPTGSVRVYQDSVARRGDLNSTLNFLLPREWLNGTVTLRLSLPGVTSCGSLTKKGASCEKTVTFNGSTPPEVDYYAVQYTASNKTELPSSDEMWEQVTRTRDLYPVDSIDYGFKSLTVSASGKPTFDKVNSLLTLFRLLNGCGFFFSGDCADRVHGVMRDTSENWSGMAVAVPGTVSSSIVKDTGATGAYGYIRNVTPHEILHTIGSNHSVNAAQNGTKSDGSKKGFCGEEAASTAPDYPWFATLPSLGTRATMGPMGNANTEIWGVNPRFLNVDDSLALSNPNRIFPTMSYCKPVSDNQGKWMGLTTYQFLLGELAPDAARGATNAAQLSLRPRAEGDSLVLRGLVDFADPKASRFQTSYTVESLESTETDEGSDWAVRLIDRHGDVLTEQAFTPMPFDVDINPERPQAPPTTGLFALVLNDTEGTFDSISAVELTYEGNVVSSLIASPNTPTVRVTRPGRGAQANSPTVRIEWTAEDKDRDRLSAAVQWRADPDADWITLAADITGGVLEVPRSDLGAASEAQVRVIVSDGLRSAQALSAPFSISDNPERVVITDPAGGLTVTGHQALGLRAASFDPEDGPDAGVVRWVSTRDGDLGYGHALDLTADELSEGTHEIVAIVTDSSGNTSRSSSITIRATRAPTYTPAATVPGPVQGLTGRPAKSLLTVSWQPPTDTGGSAIQGYTYRVGSGKPLSTVRTSITIPMPKPGRSVTVSVAAVNASGVGPEASLTYPK